MVSVYIFENGSQMTKLWQFSIFTLDSLCGARVYTKLIFFLLNSKILLISKEIYTDSFQLMRYDDECLNF